MKIFMLDGIGLDRPFNELPRSKLQVSDVMPDLIRHPV